MSTHIVTCTDEIVRGYSGTVARCTCNKWKSAWSVRDGSAESDGHAHMKESDPDYARREAERAEQWRAEQRTAGCTCKLLDFARVLDRGCPIHAPRVSIQAASIDHRHNCSCHIDPPCNQCVRCAHIDHPECPNDCQECEDHDE